MKTRPIPVKHRRPRSISSNPCESMNDPLNVVLAAVECERDNLSRAESLLGCLKTAMEYADESDTDPYYPDVVQIASEMVRKSINALDPINLPSPARGKVREEFCADSVAPLALIEVPLLPLTTIRTFSRKRSLRLHRRIYSRPLLASDASSNVSACSNISG
jgi:hypothetical protein